MANNSTKEISTIRKIGDAIKWLMRLLLDNPVDENENGGTSDEGEEKSTVRDAIGILSGIFVALVFIAGTSYEIRYITSKPSQNLTDEEVRNFNNSRMIRATVMRLKPMISKGKKHCPYVVGQLVTLTMPKSVDVMKQRLADYPNQPAGTVLLSLKKPPFGMQCIEQVLIKKSDVIAPITNK